MGKFFTYFWILFILYFIFGHPFIMHNNIPSYHNYAELANRDGRISLLYLAISVLLWALIFGFGFYYLYKRSFIARRNIIHIINYGKLVSAKIVRTKKMKIQVEGLDYKDTVVSFSNLSRETVQHHIDVVDSKPLEARFEEGKTVYLKIDETLTRPPYLVLDGIQSRINYIPFFIWLFFVAVVVGEYFYFYKTENHGFGWRFLYMWHPLLSSAGVALLIGAFGGFFMSRFFLKNTTSDKGFMKIKLKGIKATATVINVAQTGTYINEQPQVKFELEFRDKYGKQHTVTFKKIVSLLNMNDVNRPEREIFYLPDNPSIIAFEEDINAI